MATAKKAPAKKAAAPKSALKKAPAKKATVARKVATKKAPAKKTTAKKTVAKKVAGHTATGLKQDRARVAASQPHEVGYVAAKSGKPRAAVKAAAKTAGPSRKAVMNKLASA